MLEEKKTNTVDKANYYTPIAILVAGVIIAGAMYFSDGKKTPEPVPSKQPSSQTQGLDQVRPISADDHIRGNPNAEVIIVEYSDTECPYCGVFHKTMQQIMENYGKNGKVAWVYRHFPLDGLHPKARNESVAMECANELGGNDKFWEYTDYIYKVTPANNKLDPAELPKIAESVGLDVSKFNTCLVSGKYDSRIEADVQNAKATGSKGTPWSIVVTKSGKKYPINGIISYEALKKNIDGLLGLGSQN